MTLTHLSLWCSIFLVSSQAAVWTKLENCRYVANDINDGDSFMVKSKGTTYVFRIYWVDTPEHTPTYGERLKEQAEYFGITPEEALQIGREAKLFTQRFLNQGDLTVFTQWEEGQGYLQRYYAFINSEKGNLIEALVANGLARVYGYVKAWPENPGIDNFRRHLLRLEREAKSKGSGAWRSHIRVWNDLDYKKELVAMPLLTGKVNLNTASKEELLLLPGIGPVYSQRILEARPFKTIEELKKVRGIGPKTFDRLKDKVVIEDED